LLAIARTFQVDLEDLFSLAMSQRADHQTIGSVELVALRLREHARADAPLGWVPTFLQRLAQLEELDRA
jgi:hypothetical protein